MNNLQAPCCFDGLSARLIEEAGDSFVDGSNLPTQGAAASETGDRLQVFRCLSCRGSVCQQRGQHLRMQAYSAMLKCWIQAGTCGP